MFALFAQLQEEKKRIDLALSGVVEESLAVSSFLAETRIKEHLNRTLENTYRRCCCWGESAVTLLAGSGSFMVMSLNDMWFTIRMNDYLSFFYGMHCALGQSFIEDVT